MTRIRLPWFHVSLSGITALLICCATLPVWAQTVSMGTITGVGDRPEQRGSSWCDTSPLRTPPRMHVRTTTTNNAGRYVFVNVRPGNYDHVHQDGIREGVNPERRCCSRQVSTNNVVLKVGTRVQTVEVEATGVELQTAECHRRQQVNGLALTRCPALRATPAPS